MLQVQARWIRHKAISHATDQRITRNASYFLALDGNASLSENLHSSICDLGEPILHNQCWNAIASHDSLSVWLLLSVVSFSAEDNAYSNSPCTVPRGVLRHHPVKPNSSALAFVYLRKNTPWTLPNTSNSIVMYLVMLVCSWWACSAASLSSLLMILEDVAASRFLGKEEVQDAYTMSKRATER